jgi:hypothetical protein
MDAINKVNAVITGIFDGLTLEKSLKLNDCNATMFYKTLEQNPEQQIKYAYAEKYQADKLADEIIYIADNEDNYGKARNQIDARKWLAGKRAPKKYGDRIDVNVEGSIDLNAAIEQATKRITNIVVDTAIPANNTDTTNNDDDALTITELLS